MEEEAIVVPNYRLIYLCFFVAYLYCKPTQISRVIYNQLSNVIYSYEVRKRRIVALKNSKIHY